MNKDSSSIAVGHATANRFTIFQQKLTDEDKFTGIAFYAINHRAETAEQAVHRQHQCNASSALSLT